MKSEQTHIGHGTSYHCQSQRDPADEAFPCVVGLLSNLISVAIPGDPPQAEGLSLPSAGDPHARRAATALAAFLGDFSQYFCTADPVKMEQEEKGLKK